MAAPFFFRGVEAPGAAGYDATAYKHTQLATELEGRESLRLRFPLLVERYEAMWQCRFDDTAPRLRFVVARPAELKGGEWESTFIN